MRYRYLNSWDLESCDANTWNELFMSDDIHVIDEETGIVFTGELGMKLILDVQHLASYGILPNA